MKIKKMMVATAFVGLAFASCGSDDKAMLPGENSPLQFKSDITNFEAPATRMAGTTWTVGDKMGIFMSTADAGLTGVLVDGANVQHVAKTATGTFTPVGTPLRFPKDGAKVDFVAYYPYVAGLASPYVYKVDVTKQTKPEEIDLIYSNGTKGASRGDGSNEIKLGFKHELAKVKFNVTSEGGIDIAGMKVLVKQMPTKADFNLDKAELKLGTEKGDIEINVAADGTLAEGILIPTAAVAGAEYIFDLGTITYKHDASSVVLEAGKRYTYNVTIKFDGISVSESDIEDWTDVPGGDIELGGGETPTPGDGTLANPYSIASALTKTGVTAKWIEGYIVKTDAVTRAATTSFYLADANTETAKAKAVAIDLTGSKVAGNFDLTKNPELIGTKVKMQGDITGVAGAILLGNIIAQVGGAEEVTPPSGDPVEFFNETFGTTTNATERGKLDGSYTKFDMKDPVKYSDPYGTWADIRTSKTFITAGTALHVWFPAYTAALEKEAGLLIENFETGYTDVELSYDIASNKAGVDGNIIDVKCNDKVLETIPSTVLDTQNEFKTITVKVPDGTTKIEFYSGPKNEPGMGFRLDNIILKGVKK